MKRKIFYIIIYVIAVVFLLTGDLLAAKKPKKSAAAEVADNKAAVPTPKKDEGTVVANVEKSIGGEVSAINKNYISVVYHRDLNKHSQDEIGIPIGAGVTVEHKKDISQIGMGDTVEVKYEESVIKDKEGNKSSKRVAKVVTFIRAKEKKAESTALDSEAPPEAKEEPGE